MTTIALVVGSVLGTALDVAEQLQDVLVSQGYTVIFNDAPNDIPQADALLFCTSTTGRGEFPSNLLPLVNAIESGNSSVAGCHYGLIALGDSRYPIFCGAGRALDITLTALGATRIGERLELDASRSAYPDEEALKWLPCWLTALKVA